MARYSRITKRAHSMGVFVVRFFIFLNRKELDLCKAQRKQFQTYLSSQSDNGNQAYPGVSAHARRGRGKADAANCTQFRGGQRRSAGRAQSEIKVFRRLLLSRRRINRANLFVQIFVSETENIRHGKSEHFGTPIYNLFSKTPFSLRGINAFSVFLLFSP